LILFSVSIDFCFVELLIVVLRAFLSTCTNARTANFFGLLAAAVEASSGFGVKSGMSLSLNFLFLVPRLVDGPGTSTSASDVDSESITAVECRVDLPLELPGVGEGDLATAEDLLVLRPFKDSSSFSSGASLVLEDLLAMTFCFFC
jgi:hypothetical protein